MNLFRVIFTATFVALISFSPVNATTSATAPCECGTDHLAVARSGDVNMQSHVAHLYATGKEGMKQDYQKARYWYQQVINNPHADAKIIAHANLLMGLMYNSGKGGIKSYSDAMKCFKVAAKQGYYDAHVSIGRLYAHGLGVNKDYKEALRWWTVAAKKGHLQAPNLIHLLKKEMNPTTG